MDFEGADAKVSRAHEHLETLQGEMVSFFGGYEYAIGSEFDPETSEIRLYASGYTGAPLLRWGVHVGDCLHNLRSALDHVVWQFALDKLGREPTDHEARRIQFPIEETPKGFKNAWVKPYVAKAHWEWLKEWQPYHRGDRAAHHKLAVLARLNNIDKHRVIHAAALVPEGFEFEFGEATDVASYGALEIFFGEPLEKDKSIGRFINVIPSGPHPYIQAEGPFQFGVLLDDPTNPATHRASVVELLGQLGEVVDAVVSTSEMRYATTPSA